MSCEAQDQEVQSCGCPVDCHGSWDQCRPVASGVLLTAAVTLPLGDIYDINLPVAGADETTVNAMPIAGVIKTSLAAALDGVDTTDITIMGDSTTAEVGRRTWDTTGDLSIDYTIVVPQTDAMAIKTASAIMTVPDIVIPAAATVSGHAITVASADIVAEPLVGAECSRTFYATTPAQNGGASCLTQDQETQP